MALYLAATLGSLLEQRCLSESLVQSLAFKAAHPTCAQAHRVIHYVGPIGTTSALPVSHNMSIVGF